MLEISKEAILDIINTVIENAKITLRQADVDLTQFGMDSIAFIRMIVTLEGLFNFVVPEKYMLFKEMNTVNKIHKVLNIIK